MTSDRWEQINKLYHAALDLKEQERTSFLDRACRGDTELRSEVESLLNMHEQVNGFLGKPAMEEVAKAMKEEPPSLVGVRLGPYQVLGVIGAGGMGEVYKARDTRLNRTVAIKVLPRHLSERADLRQRMEREARAIGSLSHPHICPLFDIGTQDGTDFLVMEYLEGETLSQRLKRGPLPTEEVFRYAIEIASGLDQAHRKGVIHRDLKPGNIMLTEAGSKLLDFGLAKQNRPPLTRGDYRGVESATQGLTEEGMLLGTLEYMAPEQLEGKEANAGTDIFALGVVIYEMATGRKAFEGDSKASLIAKILTAQPPSITSIEPVAPPELDRVVQRCMAKKPEERWQSAAEVTSELQEIADTVRPTLKARKKGKEPGREAKEIESKAELAVPVVIPQPPKVLSMLIGSRAWKVSVIGLLSALAIGSIIVWQVWRRPKETPEKYREMPFKPLTSSSWDNPLDSAAISPDGKYLAFCSKGKLFIQVVRSGEKRSIPIPEGFYPTGAVWFPDGTKLLLSRLEDRWIQLKGQATRQLDTSLWSLSMLGGTPQKIVDHAAGPFSSSSTGASVSPDGLLVAFHLFDPERQTNDIWTVGANGEGPHRIRAPSQPNQDYFGPVWSSDGKRLFYIRNDVKGQAIESCDVRGELVTTIFSSKFPFYSLCWSPDGRILFPLPEVGPRSSIFNLWEIKVDTSTGRPLSEARRFTQWSGFAFVNAGNLSITTDGKQLALLRMNAQADVYVAELEPAGRAMKTPRRLTLVESDDAVWDWTADSRAVLFDSNRNGNYDLFRQDISQTDAETILATAEQERHPALSPDRAFVLYLVSGNPGPTRLMRVPVSGGPPELVLMGEGIKNFSCAREANLCVVAEDVKGKQILTTFDPLKGRGERLPLSDYPNFARGILSPRGKLIEQMKSGSEGLRVLVRSLMGGPAEEITFKNLIGDYGFSGWSIDGKGIYLEEWTVSDFTSLYAGLDGHSQVFWKRGSSPGYSFDYPIPSPDGRHLAFTVVTYESNAWMLENF